MAVHTRTRGREQEKPSSCRRGPPASPPPLPHPAYAASPAPSGPFSPFRGFGASSREVPPLPQVDQTGLRGSGGLGYTESPLAQLRHKWGDKMTAAPHPQQVQVNVQHQSSSPAAHTGASAPRGQRCPRMQGHCKGSQPRGGEGVGPRWGCGGVRRPPGPPGTLDHGGGRPGLAETGTEGPAGAAKPCPRSLGSRVCSANFADETL